MLTVLPGETLAQRRPVLRQARQDFLAGKFALISFDQSAAADQMPRLIARIADHDVVTPPRALLQNDAQLTAWARSLDYGDIDGIIILPGSHTEAAAEIIRWIQLQHPRLATTELTGNEMTGLPVADTASLLTVRQLNRRFGIAPGIVPFYSAGPSDSANVSIRALGGRVLNAGAAEVRRADLLLFVYQPQTSEAQFAAFITELERAVTAGYRVALADTATDQAGRDRLMNAVSSRKMLDQLFGFAVADEFTSGTALAIAQASARLVTARFLRDDADRLRRTEQAQVELLLNRWLKAAVYDPVLRPQLDRFVREQLQADPENLNAAALPRAEDFVIGEARRRASEIFSSQFRHNVHSVLLSDGSRADFRVRAIQHLQLAFPQNRTDDPEIRARVYLALENYQPIRQAQAVWELKGRENLDARLVSRSDAINFPAFDVGAGAAELSLVVAGNDKNESESYTIRSRLQKKIRRIEIVASSARGAFYALARVERDGLAGRLSQDFQITETPEFAERGVIENMAGAPWSHRDRLDVLRLMGRARMNRYYYAPPDDPYCRERWRENYDEPELTRFHELRRVADENFIELVYVISPGASLAYTSEADFTALTHRFDTLSEAGVRHFALHFAEAELTADADRARFQTVAAAQADLAKRAAEYLKRALPNATLTVMPALKELSSALPKEIPLLPAGADLQTAPTDHPLILQNDFMANDTAPWRLVLAAKQATPPANGTAISGMIFKPMNQAHAAMLPLLTAADEAWNPRAYKPEVSFADALNLLYDTRSREAVQTWASAVQDSGAFAALFQPQSGEINVPQLEQKFSALHSALESISATRERGLLRGELAAILNRAEKALDQLKNDPAYEKLPDGRYRKR
ncbi:MAG: DUF4127 family protein [Blastocatellia bacterium]